MQLRKFCGTLGSGSPRLLRSLAIDGVKNRARDKGVGVIALSPSSLRMKLVEAERAEPVAGSNSFFYAPAALDCHSAYALRDDFITVIARRA